MSKTRIDFQIFAKIDKTLSKYWLFQQIKSVKNVIFLFLITRLAIFLVTYCGSVLFYPGFIQSHTQNLPENLFFFNWTRWDAGYYAGIAEHGYTEAHASFFPFYSFLIYIVNLILKNMSLSGIMVANLSFLFALILLYKLVRDKYNHKIAVRTVFYLCIFPTSLFFVSMLSESTFLLVSVAAFYFAEKDKWVWAGIFGMLAALTRSIGIIMIVPLLWLYLENRNFDLKKIRLDVFSLLLIPMGLASFMFVILPSFGISPFYFITAQGPWRRSLDFPWWDLSSAFEVLSSYGISDFLSGKYPVLILFSFVTVLLFISLIIPLFMRLKKSYAIYALFYVLFFLSFPSHVSGLGGVLQSNLRFIVPIFPFFIYFALVGENELWDKTITVVSLLFLSLFSVFNGLGGWLS